MPDGSMRTPYILGLDLGVASIGWARIACDPDDDFKPTGLLAAGSHLFESGTDGGKAGLEGIAKGTDTPRNQQRRDARLMRRQTWRRARRKRVLLKALIRLKLLPEPSVIGLSIGDNLRRPLDIDAYIKEIDRRLRERWRVLRAATGAEAHADEQRLCYLLREAAAKGPVERYEFGRALYHLAQRRGFQSNRRADAKKKDEDAGKVKQAIGELAEKLAAFAAAGNVPTLGAYLASLNPDEQRLRGRWTARSMYTDEFDRMWAAQAEHLGLSDDARKDVFKAIFHQRPLKDQSNLIGQCSLIPGEKRCPIAHRLYQRFRMLQAVNHLTVAPPAEAPRGLSREERDLLLAALTTNGDLTFSKLRAILRFKKGTTFNLERGDETKLPGHRTDAKLRAVFGDALDSYSDDDRDRMVEDLRSFRLPEALVRRAGKRWNLYGEAATAFAAIGLEEGYAPLSLAAIRRLLPRMEEGLPYANARKDEFPESFQPTRVFDELPPVRKAMEDLRNPAVERALTEVRKLVNEMVRRYGKPALIRVELAREIKNPRKVRERISKNIRDREKERARIVKKVFDESGITITTKADIERAMLADECDMQCPYTGKQISWETLFGKHPQFDVEHIWPRSRSLDDSFMNKTLCHHEVNRSRKRGHTPREAFGGPDGQLEEIVGRMRLWKKCDPIVKAEKIARFEAESIPEGFTNRHLSDTRFIARAAADYLGLLYGGRVEAAADGSEGTQRVRVCTGGLTAWLRSGWGIDGLLGETVEKNRADHRHHAVDAIVVALSDARAVQTLARAATEADRLGRRRAFEHIDPPWDGFRDEVDALIQRVIVSHRQSRKVTGPLHDQSIYSRPMGPGGEHRIRKELHKLTVSEIRDGKIVDKRALEAIRAVVRAKLGTDTPKPQDLTKLLADPANAPLVKGHDGRMVRLRKVRVAADTGRRIGRDDKATGRWVQPSNNHHTVIVEVRDAKGRVKWEDRPVQLLDAYARQAAKKPIVERRVGEGERFLFSLAPGEFVEMDTPGDATKRAIYRVASISEGDNELKLHMDGRTTDELKKAKARVRVSGDKLRQLRTRKVRVTYLGEVLNAGG